MVQKYYGFIRRAPDPAASDPVVTVKRGPGRPPNAGGLPKIPPAETRRCFYSETEVEAWIHARIRGETWCPSTANDGPQRLISRRDMLLRVGLSYPTVWRLEKAGLFPAPVKITPSGLWTGALAAAE